MRVPQKVITQIFFRHSVIHRFEKHLAGLDNLVYSFSFKRRLALTVLVCHFCQVAFMAFGAFRALGRRAFMAFVALRHYFARSERYNL